jgi:maleylacetate reductase
MRLFSKSLPAVKENSANAEALNENQQAVWLACCGLGTVPHGASHGIGYILGSLCGVPHGYTSCVLLPAVLEWNQAELQAQLSAIAAAMGRPAEKAHVAVKNLIASLGLPTTLQEVKVQRSELDDIAERAIRHPVVKRNPRAIASVEDVRQILELAW